MKLIGLLGGASWPSTFQYYDYLNKTIAQKLGGHNSARIILYSINYHPIKSLYEDSNGWEEIPDLLRNELKTLDDMKPDCILICNNMLHKAYDILAGQGLALGAQVIHCAVETARKAQALDYKRLLLLGTKFTMEDGFYADRLRFFGMEVNTPSPEDRDSIQRILSQVSSGQEITPDMRKTILDILSMYKDNDAVILGGTELSLLLTEEESPLPLINPIHSQCDEAIKLVLSGRFKRSDR